MDRSKENIKSILDKYWAGESTLQEEKIIYQYFEDGQVDEAFKEVAPLFSYLKDERDIKIDLEEVVMRKISSSHTSGKILKLNWQRAIAIAASLLLVLSLGVSTYKYQISKRTELMTMDTFQSPDEALAQTKAALAYLSARMNKGTEKVSESLNKAESLDILNQ
ncbi:MAG: hypothetical protein ABI844_05300 [Saprospiraceae bacterium]